MKEHVELYADLMKLTQKNEAFFFKDFTVDDKTYRIFNYRLASYTDFLEPSALECRGIMFEVLGDVFLRLASLPMPKFFNYKENPFTEDVDFSKATHAMFKEDGSLISTYIHDGELRLKTKGSINSTQAIDAMRWLDKPENHAFKQELLMLTEFENTVNMEWVSPENRIVLGYHKPALKVLNVRDNNSGKYKDITIMKKYFHNVNENAVIDVFDVIGAINNSDINEKYKSVQEFVEDIPSMTGIEGYVIRLEDDMMVKVKTEWYLVRHRAKESINAPKRLFKCIVGEEVDDIRVLFHDDPSALQIIDDMVALVEPKFNHMIATVEKYYEDNKELSRKDYVIKARDELEDGFFHLCMKKYDDREPDYKGFAIYNYERYIGKVDDE